MSNLFLGSDLESLADRLAERVAGSNADPFEPVTIAVPNRLVRKWLRLHLARRLGVLFNFRCLDLDEALWHSLTQLDARPLATERLDENSWRLLVLGVLLEERDETLAPLQRYLQLHEQPLSRLSCRRAWDLADRLGTLLQDYANHRPELLAAWLDQRDFLHQPSDFHRMMERAQRTLFQHVVAGPESRLALLERQTSKRFRTLPQYALEMLHQPIESVSPLSRLHIFGLSQLSILHARTLAWLSQHVDLDFYHPNPASSRLRGSVTDRNLQTLAKSLLEPSPIEQSSDRGRALLRLWGRAGAESLGLASTFLHASNTPVEIVEPASHSKRAPTVLSRLHDHLLGKIRSGPARLNQDRSLQIVVCPGPVREVETVYNSIVQNLQAMPSLRQTDIAVLVTDMARYRPLLQATFERPPTHLQYNMVDFSAAGQSSLGQGLLGMLDLALESFTRSRVFQVLLNPCLLARLGVDRMQALTWLHWAEELGIYQGWDAEEKQQQGYPRSHFYAWRLGLQRLRLGRYMQSVGDDHPGPAPRFGHVIPFSDLASTDRDQLDAFCRAVEGLLPTLTKLRHLEVDGTRWAGILQKLMSEFLEVPADRPEEEQVRDKLALTFPQLANWDLSHASPQGLSLPLVREYVQSQLAQLEGSRGESLVGGITLAELQPMRSVPFQIVYVLGLGEDLFPGNNSLSSFDLRGAGRLPGDIRPAEARLQQFLEAVLSAKQKLYLLYNHLEIQLDQQLGPSTALQQMQRFLSDEVLADPFETVTMPLLAEDDAFFLSDLQPAYQDVLVQHREVDRYLAFRRAEREGRWQPDLFQQAELAELRKKLETDFTIVDEPTARATSCTVALGELKRFLLMPAQEALKRHLRVDEEWDLELEDDEPLITPKEAAGQLIRQTLQRLVLSACLENVEEALAGWKERFQEIYADSHLRCRVPEEAFGEIDQAAICSDLSERIHGNGELAAFLRERAKPGNTFCGPVLLGESLQPLGARLRFPALVLPATESNPQEIRVVGATPFAWAGERRFEFLVITTRGKIDRRELSSSMLEPLLLYLALLANSAPNHRGVSSQSWLLPREIRLHVAYSQGIITWTYPAGRISPAEARQYLVRLTHELLDPESFDLLPFELIASKKHLSGGLHEDFVAVSASDYCQLLEDAIEELREFRDNPLQIPPLVELIHASIPTDALAKLQRRFGLLDRGPAVYRNQEANRTKLRSP